MPNKGYIAYCPFYKTDSKERIACEDTPRRFKSTEAKEKWLTEYCIEINGYRKCPHAVKLKTLKERLLDSSLSPSEQNNKLWEYKYEQAMREEVKLNARVTKQAKRINGLTEELKLLRNKIRASERYIADLKEKNLKLTSREQQMANEINALAQIYEGRFAYLLDQMEDKSLWISSVDKWLEINEYRLLPMSDNNKQITRWRLDKRARKELGDGNETGGTTTEVSGASEEEESSERRQQTSTNTSK